jgi:peptidoglycan/xylan/chitin deacetylase (PgdA/CDA1 family)
MVRVVKLVTVFFDTEAWVEVPSREEFDFKKSTGKISEILDNYEVKAVFNTCGIVAQKFRGTIRKLHDDGHEIALHGYAHENFELLDHSGKLEGVLEKAEESIKAATGSKPIGIRSPWYISNKKIYSIFKKRGYKWVSNSHIFRTELLERPFRQFKIGMVSSKTLLRPILDVLWKRYKKYPYRNGGLVEIPLLSSQDGELLGLFSPTQETPKQSINFALKSLKKQFSVSKKFFNLNFHDWIIGTGNRPVLLEEILKHISSKSEFILPRDLIKHKVMSR